MLRRFGLLVIAGTALAACSTSGNSSTNNNPLAGVTIIQQPTPTPTPRPTATPMPTATPTSNPNATPTPTPGPTDVIVDGSFEAEGAASNTFSAWSKCSYTVGTNPAITSDITAAIVSASSPTFTVNTSSAATDTITSSAYAGTYAALTNTGTGASYTAFPPETAPPFASGSYPTDGANGICQTFVVPTNAVLTLYVNEGGYESSVTYGDQEATLFVGSSPSGTPVSIFKELNTQEAGTATNGYVERGPYALTGAPFNIAAGTTVTLFLGTYDSSPSSKYGEYMYVDDVSVIGTPVSAARTTPRSRSTMRR